MQLNTILNQVTDYKSFRFGRGHFVTDRQGGKAIEVPNLPSQEWPSLVRQMPSTSPQTRSAASPSLELCAIGVDVIAWKKGHKHLILVYQMYGFPRRLLWVGRERTEETLRQFFLKLGFERQGLQLVCSDMWKPYSKVIREAVAATYHILDRYHVVGKFFREWYARTMRSKITPVQAITTKYCSTDLSPKVRLLRVLQKDL